jgi:putative DNA primase/helicase
LVPADLTSRPQWAVWRLMERAGRLTKIPHYYHEQERRWRWASSTNPATWSTFGNARASVRVWNFDGPGFFVSEDDPFVITDCDHCLEPKTGALEPWAADLVSTLDSYPEISPSGTGLHIIV